MKKLFVLPIAFFCIVIMSCELIPDLNPNTNEGADITVFEVNDTLVLNKYGYNKSYDFNNDGINELGFEEESNILGSTYSVNVNGGVLVESIVSGYYFKATSLSNNNSSINLLSNFQNSGALLSGSYATGPLFSYTDWYWSINNGLNKYLMVKIILGSKYHYGWIEYSSNYNLNDDVGTIVFKRFGVSNEAGKIIRAGQTE